MFCKHEWEEISKDVLPSAWEQLSKTAGNDLKKITNVDPVLFQKKIIIVLRCKKCGKIERVVETNP